MKVLGVTNGDIVIASVSHYDYNSVDGLMADGGQPGTNHYAGYNRFSGKSIWFDIPEKFSDLYNDYSFNGENRAFGVWKLSDVKILEKAEYPDVESLEYKMDNFIWGTRGVDGKSPLKYVNLIDCETDHLLNILSLDQSIHTDTRIVIKGIIISRKSNNG